MNNDNTFEWTDMLVAEFFECSKIKRPDTTDVFSCIARFKEKKQRKPLFTTEDGVNVYSGDKAWWVDIELYRYGYSIFANIPQNPILYSDRNKIFSTEEIAYEYILQNKPLLSLNDLLSVWGVPGNEAIKEKKQTFLFQSFKKLANSKLNNQ